VKAIKRMVKRLAALAALQQSPAQQDEMKRAALAEYKTILAEATIGNCENSHKLWFLGALVKGTTRPAEVGWAALLNTVVRMWNLTIHPHCRGGKTPIETATGHTSLPYQAKLHSYNPDCVDGGTGPAGHLTEAELVAVGLRNGEDHVQDMDQLQDEAVFGEGLARNTDELEGAAREAQRAAREAQRKQAVKMQQKHIQMYQVPPAVGDLVQLQQDRRNVAALQSSAINAVVMAQVPGAKNRQLAAFTVANSEDGAIKGSLSAADFRLVAAGVDGLQPHPGYDLKALQQLAKAGGVALARFLDRPTVSVPQSCKSAAVLGTVQSQQQAAKRQRLSFEQRLGLNLGQLLQEPYPEQSHFAGVKNRLAQEAEEEARDLAMAIKNSLLSLQNTNSDWDKLNADLAAEGKPTIDVLSDGNCFYASVALAIKELDSDWVASRLQALPVGDLEHMSLRFITAQQLMLSPDNYRDSLAESDYAYAKAKASVPAEIWAGSPPDDEVPGDGEYRRWARGHCGSFRVPCVHRCLVLCPPAACPCHWTEFAGRSAQTRSGGAVWSDRRGPERPSHHSRRAPAGREPRLQPLPRSSRPAGAPSIWRWWCCWCCWCCWWCW
jgi:hypothetical protein